MTTDLNTIKSSAATLTENELFCRFLGAPVRVEEICSVSMLAPPSKEAVSIRHAREHFFGWYNQNSFCLPDNIEESILDGLTEEDNPAEVIDCVIADLEGLAFGMRAMKETFNALRNATITEDTVVGVGLEASAEDLRYALPELKEPGE